jgi:hypothetical protein
LIGWLIDWLDFVLFVIGLGDFPAIHVTNIDRSMNRNAAITYAEFATKVEIS